jgi:hypothetical protein
LDVCIHYVNDTSVLVVAVVGGLLSPAIGIGMVLERGRRESAPGL